MRLSNLVGLFVLIILAISWNLMAGYGGMISIGQQAFIGAGGYGVIYLADQIGVPLLLAVPLAGVLCALIALPTSLLLFRLAGGYFAIGTWVRGRGLQAAHGPDRRPGRRLRGSR